MNLRRTNAIIFAIFNSVLSVILNSLVISLSIPVLALDSVGTIFTSLVYGPWYGALTGLITSVILKFSRNYRIIPLILINISISIVVGVIFRKKKVNFYNILVIGLILGIISGIILVLTNPFTYIDLISVISINIVDKFTSSLIVFLMSSIITKIFIGSKNIT